MILNNKFLIIIIIFISNLFLIDLPSVNFEHSFYEAAKEFEFDKKKAMQDYFNTQANTFVYPFLIFYLKILIGMM